MTRSLMWPFGKKTSLPEPVSRGEMTAQYDIRRKGWVIPWDGIEFYLPGLSFNESAFEWAKEAAPVIRALDDKIRIRVTKCLEHWPCDKTKTHISCVYLDAYQESKSLDLDFLGDESWGDLGVNVIIKDGKIVDAYGSD
jgi:hypothetical protein